MNKKILSIALLLLTVGSYSCGGSGTAEPTPEPTPNPSTTYTVGGILSGLDSGKTIVLQNNAGDDLTLTTNGSFTFASSLSDSATYEASIKTQPLGQICIVTNGTGTISASNITTISVNCTTEWARSVTAGENVSDFYKMSIDSANNIYAVGIINGNSSYTFGEDVTVNGAYADGNNVVIVKYDSDGVAKWARSVTAGTESSTFYDVSTDIDGNVYAVGRVFGIGSYTFAEGITINCDDFVSAIIVKYNSEGVAQWAKNTTGGYSSTFKKIAINTNGNIYTVGTIYGTEVYTFAEGVSASGSYATGENVVVVKYNSSGIAQWAKTVEAGDEKSGFNAVSTDTTGNVYAVGYIYFSEENAFDFGGGVPTINGISNNKDVVIVKYNSEGVAQWAKTVTTGANESNFDGIKVDSENNVYVIGRIKFGNYTFSEGVSASNATNNIIPIIVKYNTNGTALWVKAPTGATGGESFFYDLITNTTGDIYAVASIKGTADYTFSEGITVNGTNVGQSAVMLKYNSDGDIELIRIVGEGTEDSLFRGISLGSNNYVYVVGSIEGIENYVFDEVLNVSGTYSGGNNTLIIKYPTQ